MLALLPGLSFPTAGDQWIRSAVVGLVQGYNPDPIARICVMLGKAKRLVLVCSAKMSFSSQDLSDGLGTPGAFFMVGIYLLVAFFVFYPFVGVASDTDYKIKIPWLGLTGGWCSQFSGSR